MPVKPSRTPLADHPAAHRTALLVIDMISQWDFPDADKLAAEAVKIAPRIAALKKRCTSAGVPTVYVNDNRGRWQSEFRELARLSVSGSAAGKAIGAVLLPEEKDYAVLKPKHSAFFATPLDLLLRHLRATRLIMAGVATDLCIVMSAADARLRDYDVVVPRDCVASLTTARNARALRTLSEVHGFATMLSRSIRFEN